MTIDPGTSSVVASSFRSLAIFWAKFTGFSHFLVVASERGFLMPLQEFIGHFKTGKILWLTLKNAFVRFWLFKGEKPVWFSFSMLVWFSLARTVVWLSSLVSAIFFSSKRFLVLLSTRSFLKFSKNLNFNPKFGRHSFSLNLFISKVIFFVARVAFLFSR